MKRRAWIVAAVGGVLVLVVWMWRRQGEPAPRPTVAPEGSAAAGGVARGVTPATKRARPPEPVAPAGISATEKAARVDRIERDYDEIRAKASADYTAAGANFPGGVTAFMRQLALLEREKRADLAAVLSPRELEDLEMRETAAGQRVQQRLGNSAATDEQRRAVFRLQRDFNDQFALTFDTTPAALLEREKARQVMETGAWMVLTRPVGQSAPDLFAAWNDDFAQAKTFAVQQGLSADAAWALWDARNQFTVKRLEVLAQPGLSPDQQRAALADLVRQTETRVLSIVGGSAFQAGRNDVLGWLPPR